MAKRYTLDDVVGMLRIRQGERSNSALANEIGVHKSYIGDIYKGRKAPGPTILKYLGIVAEVKTAITYKVAS